nr:MerR family transcriptional regulator [uncultured Caproiciproducens sp.]
MLIKDVCRECKLTKKAIEYYEKQGLIQPEKGENNYRNYSDENVSILKKISILRKLGIGIPDIKSILASKNKTAVLSKCKYLMELKLQRAVAQHKGMEHFIYSDNIDAEFEYIQSNLDEFFTIKEKLIQAFPGNYGMYLCVHFGRFLNGRIDSWEKEDAYHQIIDYLDSIDDLELSAELEEYLESCFSALDTIDFEKMNGTVISATDNIEEYIENNQDTLEEYLRIRNSAEFKNSPAYQMQKKLLDFQQNSGYYSVFLPNLKILSPSYREYTDKLEKANKLFIEKFPQSEELYR